MASDDLTLAAEFPPAGRQQWLKLVDGVLKGAAFDRALVARTYDGLLIEPLYDGASGEPIAGRSLGVPWQVMQRIEHPDPVVANDQALRDVAGGATALCLTACGSIGGYGYGLGFSPENLRTALAGISLDKDVAVELDLGLDSYEAVKAIGIAVRSRNVAPAAARIRFGLDPLGATLVNGQASRPWDSLLQNLAENITELAEQGFKGPFVVADGRVVHNAGGSEAQELAYVIGAAITYLRALESADVALDDARCMIFFRMAADADQFLTIAKFRALRKLWARVEEACGLEPRPIFVSAETAWRMMTKRDPWVNMLRTTIATFAAGIAGANCVCVLPHTVALGLPDQFARRVARNTQLVLLEESNLAKVADPGVGSGGIEDLTHKLCDAAWRLFQDIERAGITSVIEQGGLQDKVAATRAQRQHAIALRRDALTGTSEFPNLAEAPVSVLDVPTVAAPSAETAAVVVKALPRMRLAEPFERLRDLSDRMLARTGHRPKIFLANLGEVGDFTARAMFAKNFFEAGGIEAAIPDAFDNLDAVVDAFKQSGAALACLCSSNEIYQTQAAPAAEMLAAAGARHIYMAGRPGGLENALTAAGVQTFIYVGCDVLATLEAAYRFIG
jgi:methylmalonyl-CoA mutase